MSGLVGLKTDAMEIVYQRTSAAVDSWPLMESPTPVVLILVSYLLFVLKFGPAFMKDKEAYNLKGILLAYNFFQVVFSAFLVIKYTRYHINNGFMPMICDDEQKQTLIASCIWWYLVAKVSELLDTVFFVLRKKENQVTFLHLYHHSLMMFGSWLFLKFAPSDQVILLGLLNSLVHTVMYSYYGLAALGPNVAKYIWWKKYITKMQMVQFCLGLMYLAAASFRPSCTRSKGVIYFVAANLIVFMMLFYNFYRKSYNKKIVKVQESKNNHLVEPKFINVYLEKL